jgi:2-polyprenyl-6-methoxyphenol hydroxylase-like FAD-dependent oxidoreductase
LSGHFRSMKGAIDRPLLLSIVVGRCAKWFGPGVLLLGDAAHPMSPIRAQGINMALRDGIVAAKYLTEVGGEMDALLPQIQAEREPEIIEIQRLQQAEIAQAKLMRDLPVLRHMVSVMAPVIGPGIRRSWRDRQLKLRRGIS